MKFCFGVLADGACPRAVRDRGEVGDAGCDFGFADSERVGQREKFEDGLTARSSEFGGFEEFGNRLGGSRLGGGNPCSGAVVRRHRSRGTRVRRVRRLDARWLALGSCRRARSCFGE